MAINQHGDTNREQNQADVSAFEHVLRVSCLSLFVGIAGDSFSGFSFQGTLSNLLNCFIRPGH